MKTRTKGFIAMNRKRVAVGSDDNYHVAEYIVKLLEEKGYEVVRFGSLKTGEPYSWAKVGFEVGSAVSRGEVEWGIVICFTGTGVSIAANKVKGVRAALCTDAESARGARLWNDANVLAISARLTTEYKAREIIEAWISTEKIDESEVDNINYLKKLDEL